MRACLSPDERAAAFVDALGALLREPLRAGMVVLVAPHAHGAAADTPAVEWIDDGGALDPRAAGRAGWLFRLGREGDGGPDLFVESSHAGVGSDQRVQMAALLCRTAWQLHQADSADSATFPPALADAIHALRNGLNASVMNAAVLVSHSERVPDSLRPVVERVEQATTRSADALHRLVALMEAMR